MRVTAIAIADESSAACELVMGKTLKTPVALFRNYSFQKGEHEINELIRPEDEDLFR